MRRTITGMPGAAALLVGCLALSGCSGGEEPDATPAEIPEAIETIDPAPPAYRTDAKSPPAPAYAPLRTGWRYETFGDVVVSVPERFVPGGTGQQVDQWCVGRSRQPVVGRPFGPTTQVACPADDDRQFDPSFTGSFVGFDLPPPGETEPAEGGDIREGDRVTRLVEGIELIVQAPERLRQRVLDTVATVPDGGEDPYGCPVDDPAAADPSVRPFGPGLATLVPGQVTDVAVCTYLLRADRVMPADIRLLASSRLAGAGARRAVAGLLNASPGGGPDGGGACADGFGEQLTVLRIGGDFPFNDADERRVVLRYDGCRGEGIDDGRTVRRLTPQVLRPFLAGTAGTA